MARYVSNETVRRLQLVALAKGGSLLPFADGSHSRTVEWDIGGRCRSPVVTELHGRAERKRERFLTVTNAQNKPNFAVLHVRCRKCDACLRQRAMKWSYRAKAEFQLARRTWLCTFTLSTPAMALLLSRARVKASKAGVDFETLTPEEQFRKLDSEGFMHVQLWLKRLRKAGHVLRYLCTTEAHKSGNPHWHMLLHECGPPIKYSDLKGQWPLGFDSFKLVENAKGAVYATKYLSKDVRARVRASTSYGTWREAEAEREME